MSGKTDLEMISVASIRTDGGTQSRSQINDDVVSEYAEAIGGGDKFPPVTVFFDGAYYWLGDGFHRVAAHKAAGAKQIAADIQQGDKRAAILHSVGANANHGLRRTNADKRRAVSVLLADLEWAGWSDRDIARQCGVSHPFVAKLKESHAGNVTSEKSAERTYTDKHGNTSTMNTGNIGGTKPADDPQPEKVEAVAPAEATPQPAAKKNPFASLTREALEDDLQGAMDKVAELQAEITKLKAINESLTRKNTELSSGNQGAVISKLQTRAAVLKKRLDDSQTATKREEYKRKKADERVAELENMEIPL